MTNPILRPIVAWLRDIPGSDDTARGNGVALQLLLIMIGSSLPLIWPYRIAALIHPLTRSDWIDLCTDSIVAVSAWVGVMKIRRGDVQGATRLFVASMLLSQALTYVQRGLMSSMLDQTYVVLPVVLGGLILGRRTLWWLYGLLIVLFAAGAAADVSRLAAKGAQHPMMGAINVLPLALSYLAITMVLDQCVSTLRGSVMAAERRGLRLEEMNRVLEDEIAAHKNAREQLIHAQKVEAVGRLAGGVAHDFNNILSVIEGYAEAREESDDPAVLRSALYGVAAAARRGAAISRKLLSFGRRDVARLEVIDLKRALRDARQVLRQLFSQGVTLSVDIADDARYVRFDPEQLELMILNIAANARDAMSPDGRFDIQVTRLSPEHVRMAFRDDGQGMPEHVRQSVFEPFFTTKPAHAGSGLGLAVVRDVVRSHGGTVGVESLEGRGTTLLIDLPALAGHGDGVLRPSPLIHTLLVEDEDVLREMWSRRFEAEGFLVVEAGSGAQAIRLATELAHTLNLVVTDLRLGDNDPDAWTEQLRALLPEVPILVVSSHFPPTIQRTKGVGILHKPCSPDLLVSEATKLVETSWRRGLRGEDVAAASHGG